MDGCGCLANIAVVLKSAISRVDRKDAGRRRQTVTNPKRASVASLSRRRTQIRQTRNKRSSRASTHIACWLVLSRIQIL